MEHVLSTVCETEDRGNVGCARAEPSGSTTNQCDRSTRSLVVAPPGLVRGAFPGYGHCSPRDIWSRSSLFQGHEVLREENTSVGIVMRPTSASCNSSTIQERRDLEPAPPTLSALAPAWSKLTRRSFRPSACFI